MRKEWNNISNNLLKIYTDLKIKDKFDKDENYLKKAFNFTENLWEKEFTEIKKIKTVLVSEAPLFGSKKTYIYNPETAPTAFFYYQDLKSFPSFKDEKYKTAQEKKKIIFFYFRNYGIIVLNIFPFAFNQIDTSLNYQKMSKNVYKELLRITEKNYLIPRLKKCFIKSDGIITFLYRYKRLFEKTESHFEKVLNSFFTEEKFLLDSVNGSNMTLDRKKFSSYLKL